jgi:NitT/TauT family transport system substrate-binding protein
VSDRRKDCSRREFVSGLTLAGTAGLVGVRPGPVAAEPLLETTRLRISDQRAGICVAPQYVAEELLRGEGFADVQYLRKATFDERLQGLANGEVDLLVAFVSSLIVRASAGDPIVFLAGSHVGCFEVFGGNHVRTIRDLKGKTVAISALGMPDHLFLSVILLQIGLDPRREVNWVTHPTAEAMRLLSDGKIDALLNFPPVPQELRARKIGHSILKSSVDRPWAQYFCCVVAGHREFVRKHPVATKRALRGLMKGADVCALEPERVARFLVDKGYTERDDYALAALRDIPYRRWREYDPEDSVRFYALRLHEAGLIKSSPQKIISQGTDWRFINELRKELKG